MCSWFNYCFDGFNVVNNIFFVVVLYGFCDINVFVVVIIDVVVCYEILCIVYCEIGGVLY